MAIDTNMHIADFLDEVKCRLYAVASSVCHLDYDNTITQDELYGLSYIINDIADAIREVSEREYAENEKIKSPLTD